MACIGVRSTSEDQPHQKKKKKKKDAVDPRSTGSDGAVQIDAEIRDQQSENFIR
jgi:hypothetical protein